MAIREIIILPDKQLRLISKPVEKVTSEVRKLADDMFETMYDAPGIGLAAIQIAVPLRLITMDIAKKDDEEDGKKPRVFINPEIISASEELSVYEEGCLSIPEYYEEVERPATVRIRYMDLDGKTIEEEASWPVRDLHSARDRPSQWRAVRRLPFQAEARPRAEEVHQARQARGVGFSAQRCNRSAPTYVASFDLHGHAGFRGADAARTRGPWP
jgi:peptide deformylase